MSVRKKSLFIHLRTYLLTQRSRVLLEKLTGSQPVKKFPAFYVTRRFITAFTNASHLSLSWAKSSQSIIPHPTTRRSILILSSHLRLGLPRGKTDRHPYNLFLAGYHNANQQLSNLQLISCLRIIQSLMLECFRYGHCVQNSAARGDTPVPFTRRWSTQQSHLLSFQNECTVIETVVLWALYREF